VVGLLHRARAALAQAFAALPALVVAWLCLRVAESIHAGAGGLAQSTLFGAAIGNDALALLRFGFAILLGALPLALIASPRARVAYLGLIWSILLCAHAALLQYAWIAGVPLGADLFAYSAAEVATTLAGGQPLSPLLAVALALALGLLWALLILGSRGQRRAGGRGALVALVASLLAFALLPGHYAPRVVDNDAELGFIVNKSAWFADRSLAWLAGAAPAQEKAPGTSRAAWEGLDPRYPFARPESTPDTLGPLFKRGAGAPPTLVFIIVEGLGRSFSGPNARLGSFTPFLDQLAGRSLYFENFLAGQGRTFGVLTTVFGSLPFGDNGLSALGEHMPRHASLPSVLRAHGYRTRFITGSNVAFDNEAAVLRAMGVDSIASETDFGAPFKRSNEWGYSDADLMQLALTREREAGAGPALSIIQTTGMHNPFTFAALPAYRERVQERVAALKLPLLPLYVEQRDIFASILHLDDALRGFFEQARTLPDYANTIFIVTGDHRLPELPMESRIERYHVPLIVYSPLLETPRSIKSVSSQFDLAPSLLAYLAKQYGIKTPAQVSWVGTGLDTEPAFRNLHVIPLKQTKTELSDFVSGTAYLAQDRLYTLGDGMATDRVTDGAMLARARAQFASFARANALAGKADALTLGPVALKPYGGERTLRAAPLVAEAGAVKVSGLHALPGTAPLSVQATITNHAPTPSLPFAPLLVLADEGGRELGETVGAVRSLAPGEAVTVTVQAHTRAPGSGVYYVSMIPAHPASGRALGAGQYRVRVVL